MSVVLETLNILAANISRFTVSSDFLCLFSQASMITADSCSVILRQGAFACCFIILLEHNIIHGN